MFVKVRWHAEVRLCANWDMLGVGTWEAVRRLTTPVPGSCPPFIHEKESDSDKDCTSLTAWNGS